MVFAVTHLNPYLMMTSPSTIKMEVPSLFDITTSKIVHHVWKQSKAEELLIERSYKQRTSKGGFSSSGSRFRYCHVIQNTLGNILNLDNLPKPVVMRLGSCFIDLVEEIREFGRTLVSSLEVPSRRNTTAAIKNISLSLDGHVNKAKTIIDTVVLNEVSCSLSTKFTAQYCVDIETAVAAWEAKRIRGEDVKNIYAITQSFIEPGMFWAPTYDWARSGLTFYQNMAMRGNVEALKYYINRLDASKKQAQLCQAFMFALKSHCELDKILFFKNILEHQYWIEIVRRNFRTVFSELYSSLKYSHVCCDIFRELHEKLDFKMIESVLRIVLSQTDGQLRCSKCKACQLNDNLQMWHTETVFLSIWNMIKPDYKLMLFNKLFKYINMFVTEGRINTLAILAEDSVFDNYQSRLFASAVILSLMTAGKGTQVNDFLMKLKQETRNILKTIANVLHSDYFEHYVIYADNCRSCTIYDHLLNAQFPSYDDLKSYKESLIQNEKFLSKIIAGIGEGVITMSNLKQIVTWAFGNDTKKIQNYIQSHLIASMLEIFKNHIVLAQRELPANSWLALTDLQIRNILKKISRETELLHDLCLNAVKTEDFPALSGMLSCVFPIPDDRKAFLLNFFKTEKGVRAVHNLIISETFDNKFFSHFYCRENMTTMLNFQQHCLISGDIITAVESIVNDIRVTSLDCPYYDFDKHRRLLPNESESVFTAVCDINCTVLKHVLRNNFSHS